MAYLPKEGGDFAPVPPGSHPAICYRVIDLGTQEVTWQGDTKYQHKILISWEIADPEIRMADGRPFTIGRRYTWSMSEKGNLRPDLESWRGVAFTERDLSGAPGAFEIQNILGKPCLLSVVHDTKGGKTYANIKAIAKLPKGMTMAAQENPSVFIWLTPEEFDGPAFASLSDNLREIIKKSPEYNAVVSGHETTDDPAPSNELPDDSVPF